MAANYLHQLGADAAERSRAGLRRRIRINEAGEAETLRTSRVRAGLMHGARRVLDSLPERWRRKLRAGFDQRAGGGALYAELMPAAAWLDAQAGDYGVSRLPLGAHDAMVIAEAERCAAECAGWIECMKSAEGGYTGLVRFCERAGVVAPKPTTDESGRKSYSGAVARLVCPIWWRRNLRAAHAKIVEGGAIRLGFVHRFQDCYVSNESVDRRAQQNRRNARTLESTHAVNDDGEVFSLAELAATGISNKAIKRGELMLRMRGFEEIAGECGHVGEFVTMTAPSRMHKWRTVRNARGQVVRVEENPSYDGTKPNEAQSYHARVWARIRAAMKRITDAFYGFRIAEPNHDGTPHWHMLLFMPNAVRAAFRAAVRRYALADSGQEPGAQRYRVRFVRIRPEAGGAAGYIAKYVAKNIDGYGIEKDLFGNEAITASQRVEAWASTWRIRQFQQIGGAPVGVWRELRRVQADTVKDAPQAVQAAHAAVSKGEESRADYAAFLRAMGGVAIARGAMLLSVARRAVAGVVGRYGDAPAAKPFGVRAIGGAIYESLRRTWRIVAARSVAPWTRVYNCTPPLDGGGRLIELAREVDARRRSFSPLSNPSERLQP